MQVYAAGLTDQEKRQIAECLSGQRLNDQRDKSLPLKCEKMAPFDLTNPVTVRSWGVDLENSRFTPGDIARLSIKDIEQLRLKWAFAFSGAQRARSQPTIAGGRLFVGGQSDEVHALDARSRCSTGPSGPRGRRDLFGNVYAVDGGRNASLEDQGRRAPRPRRSPAPRSYTTDGCSCRSRRWVPSMSPTPRVAAAPIAAPFCSGGENGPDDLEDPYAPEGSSGAAPQSVPRSACRTCGHW